MKRVIYVLQFKGNGVPKDGAPDVLAVSSKAAGASVRTQVFPDGLSGKIESEGGAEAVFASTVRMGSDNTFDESGSISFGSGHSLRFVTAGQGHIAPTREEGVSAGAAVWKIDGGEGTFSGATGFITSNFWFNGAGEVTANQFGVIELP